MPVLWPPLFEQLLVQIARHIPFTHVVIPAASQCFALFFLVKRTLQVKTVIRHIVFLSLWPQPHCHSG